MSVAPVASAGRVSSFLPFEIKNGEKERPLSPAYTSTPRLTLFGQRDPPLATHVSLLFPHYLCPRSSLTFSAACIPGPFGFHFSHILAAHRAPTIHVPIHVPNHVVGVLP